DDPTDIRCSCLLQPRCLHIAAVVAVLELADFAAPDAEAVSDPDDEWAHAPEEGPQPDADPPSADGDPTATDASPAADTPSAPGASAHNPTTVTSAGPSGASPPGASPPGASPTSASARRTWPSASAGQASAGASTQRPPKDPAARD